MAHELTPGSRFPDYELPDTAGTRRKLSELQGRDPLFLMLARGSWCPKETRQARWMVDMQPEFKVGYTQVVTVSSTDSLLGCKEWKESLGADWAFLSDLKHTIQSDFDLTEYTDPEHEPIIPHSLFLEPGLIIHTVFNGYWYWGRPSPEETRQVLRQITRKIRPDWDITTADQRDLWKQGRRELFFPYRVRKAA